MVSTRNRAGWSARSMALRISAMRLVDAGGGLVVDHHHGLDRLGPVLGQDRLDLGRIDAAAPVAGDELDLDAPARRHLPPQGGEVAGLEHQHPVAGRERVDDGRLPGARCPRRDTGSPARGSGTRPARLQHLPAELGEVRTAMVDHRHVHGAQHALGHRARARDVQEVASGPCRHRGPRRRFRCARRSWRAGAPGDAGRSRDKGSATAYGGERRWIVVDTIRIRFSRPKICIHFWKTQALFCARSALDRGRGG